MKKNLNPSERNIFFLKKKRNQERELPEEGEGGGGRDTGEDEKPVLYGGKAPFLLDPEKADMGSV